MHVQVKPEPSQSACVSQFDPGDVVEHEGEAWLVLRQADPLSMLANLESGKLLSVSEDLKVRKLRARVAILDAMAPRPKCKSCGQSGNYCSRYKYPTGFKGSAFCERCRGSGELAVMGPNEYKPATRYTPPEHRTPCSCVESTTGDGQSGSCLT